MGEASAWQLTQAADEGTARGAEDTGEPAPQTRLQGSTRLPDPPQEPRRHTLLLHVPTLTLPSESLSREQTFPSGVAHTRHHVLRHYCTQSHTAVRSAGA